MIVENKGTFWVSLLKRKQGIFVGAFNVILYIGRVRATCSGKAREQGVIIGAVLYFVGHTLVHPTVLPAHWPRTSAATPSFLEGVA